MTALEVVGEVRRRGGYLRCEEGRIKAGPQQLLDPALVEELRARKEEIISSLKSERRDAVARAVQDLLEARPEFRERRVGQITCGVIMWGHLPEDFPRSVDPGGFPKDREVAEVLSNLRERGEA